MCELFGYTRQAWYDTKKRQSKTQLSEVLVLYKAKNIRSQHKQMGCEKIHDMLTPFFERHGIKMGRDKFFYLMSEHGLQVRKTKKKARTTNSNHLYKRYPNIVSDITLLNAGKLWVSDILTLEQHLDLHTYRS